MSLRPVSGSAHEVYEELRGWVDHGGEPLIVRTSGSTGEPKDVRLSHAAVLASAHAALERLGGPGQWVSALPPTGVGGLQVLVRSIIAGREPVFTDDRSIVDAVAALDAPRTYASLVPTQLFRLIEGGLAGALAPLDAVLLGGAAAPAPLLERARAAGVTIVRTYGMSETCGGCVYDGVPLDGVRIRIGEGGVVELAGRVLFDGYGTVPRGGEWFRTGDLGELTGPVDRPVLHVFGRADDVAVSGGVNVPLPAVEALVGRVGGVREVSAVAVDDDEWGQKVVAFVVGDVTGAGVREQAARLAAADDIPRAHVPREVRVVNALPLLPGGKVDRQRLVTAAS